MTLKLQLYQLAEKMGVWKGLQHVGRAGSCGLYVLAYHRVDEPGRRPWLDPDLISATPDQFAQQMALLAQAYHPVGIEEVLEAVDSGKPLPPQAVLVTVDDAYRDFLEVIEPVTRRWGIRPVLFTPTAFVGSGMFWWDRLYRIVEAGSARLDTWLGVLPVQTEAEKRNTLDALVESVRSLSFDEAQAQVDELEARVHLSPVTEPATLTWDELRQLAKRGVTIAAHTHSHPILSRVPLERVKEEVLLSQALVRQEIGQALPVFAFPDGKSYAFTAQVTEQLKAAGFRLVFTTVEGRADLTRHDLLCLPRLAVWRTLSLAQFHYHLTPVYDALH